MADALEQVLRLVAEGRLTAAQAAPILDALGTSRADGQDPEPAAAEPGGTADDRRAGTERTPASSIRIEITESGRKVVNLRIPVSLGRLALDHVPGLSGDHV